MPSEYPKREQFFSHKFVRLVMRFCGAQEIGPEGSWLLTIIAHTEDARRYTGPVTFWNEQLISVMGLNSRKQLDRIRDRCIEAGWLHYERDSKRAVGKYWVKVPPNLDGMDDADISCDAVLWSKNDTRTSQECPITVPRMSHEVVHERPMSVPPSTLSLNLSHSETETETETEGEPGTIQTDLAEHTAAQINPLPIGSMRPSAVFEILKPEHLRQPRAVISWFRRQLSAISPVLPGTRAYLIFALCCAKRASGRGVKEPVGSFVSLINGKNWAAVRRYRDEAERDAMAELKQEAVA